MHIYPDALAVVRDLRPDEPVILNRPHAARRAARYFVEKFPGKVLYAVKANPAPDLIQVLWDSGVTHYDVASITEVRLVRGILPDAVLCFMHPVKTPAAITEAYFDHGVRTFVLDACFVCELHELALALTHEYQLPTTWLWEILREETEGAFDAVQARVEPQLWRAEREQFLHAAWPTRSVLRMHLQQYADYRLQHRLPNPLGAAQAFGKV